MKTISKFNKKVLETSKYTKDNEMKLALKKQKAEARELKLVEKQQRVAIKAEQKNKDNAQAVIDYERLDNSRQRLNTKEKKIFRDASKKLDKFYTAPEVAKKCYLDMKMILTSSNINVEKALFIEPSAGAGVFLDVIEERSIGFDIMPTKNLKHKIRKNNFLTNNISNVMTKAEFNTTKIVLGNPPFGERADMAIQFFNMAFEYSNVVGYIVPLSLRKYPAQKRIREDARLVLDITLPVDAFELVDKSIEVGCCFQVWVLPNSGIDLEDKRLKSPAKNKHTDFEMCTYDPRNKSVKAIQFIEDGFHFIVKKEWYDAEFTEIFSDIEQCEDPKRKTTFILFRAQTVQALDRMHQIDFSTLIKEDRVGFWGVAQTGFIKAYDRMFGETDITTEDHFIDERVVEAEIIENVAVLTDIKPIEKVIDRPANNPDYSVKDFINITNWNCQILASNNYIEAFYDGGLKCSGSDLAPLRKRKEEEDFFVEERIEHLEIIDTDEIDQDLVAVNTCIETSFNEGLVEFSSSKFIFENEIRQARSLSIFENGHRLLRLDGLNIKSYENNRNYFGESRGSFFQGRKGSFIGGIAPPCKSAYYLDCEK